MINYLSQEKLSGSKGVQLASIPTDLDIWLEPKALRVGTLNDDDEVNNLISNPSRYDRECPARERIYVYFNRAEKCSISMCWSS